MGYDPITHLGLSCPSGGDFYICQDSKVQFLGCCEVDPCGSEHDGCPSSAIHQASFDRDRYDDIPGQSCVASTLPALWYTCISGPTFLGCCASNACANGGVCPEEDLVGATLDSDPRNAEVFLTATPTSATSIKSTAIAPTSSVSSPTSTAATSTPTSNPPTDQKGTSPPIGAIAGGVVGGLLLLALVAFLFFRCGRRKRRVLPIAQSDAYDIAMSQALGSPYHDSFHGSPRVPPAPVSPLSTASVHRKSLSESFSSFIGLKRSSVGKRGSYQTTAGHDGFAPGQLSPGFLNPISELEGRSTNGISTHAPPERIYYEVEGSVPGRPGGFTRQ
ncbi:hypothetical protein SAMD00023353_2600200 [Rosellinia necatrix]|uniref:Uncharacterized protein n=1 Tax=Rosellinia necatrix TaxID=77044 RepID=A0A1W2THD8_ROSNE|nr:hypothetical protein SAMD00023353_2600200 [Rosellinia necatrix]